MRYSLYFDNTRQNKDGKYSLSMVFTDNRKRFKVSTGITAAFAPKGTIFPKQEKDGHAKTCRLTKIVSEVERFILLNENKDFEYAKRELKGIVNGVYTENEPLVSYIRRYTETKDNPSTRYLYGSTADKVEEFDGTADFSTVNAEWLRSFERFLKKKKMSVNTISIHMRNLRTVFNWCIDNEYTDRYPFRRYSIKQERVAINNISARQLATLRDYPVEPWQEIYRDLFMLSFYLCGINSVDLLNCRKLTRGRMVYRRQKTGKVYDIPVPPEAMAIIEKYKGKKFLLSPMDSYADYRDFRKHWNQALKKIGRTETVADRTGRKRKLKYMPLFPDITVYTARYTFASIAAELDIPRETIALCLGHSWADVTSHYIAYDMRKVDEAVRKVIDYVNGIKGDMPDSSET